MIKIYSTESCPWCKKAKSYFQSKNIDFKDVNVAEDMQEREEMVKLSGQQGVPVINIDGRIIVGFDRSAIDESLKELEIKA